MIQYPRFFYSLTLMSGTKLIFFALVLFDPLVSQQRWCCMYKMQLPVWNGCLLLLQLLLSLYMFTFTSVFLGVLCIQMAGIGVSSCIVCNLS